MKESPDITLYDKYDYDYSKYWHGREYEHNAEVQVLDRIMKKVSGSWFVDIGGSYGRHIPQYHQKFHHCILLDYSIKSLKQARKWLKETRIPVCSPYRCRCHWRVGSSPRSSNMGGRRRRDKL